MNSAAGGEGLGLLRLSGRAWELAGVHLDMSLSEKVYGEGEGLRSRFQLLQNPDFPFRKH